MILQKKNYLHIIPYYNPWCWFNDRAYNYTLEILSTIFEKYSKDNFPIVVCGASMGGMSGLIFSFKYLKNVKACIVNCPVVDLEFYYNSNWDYQNTIYDAFYEDDKNMFEKIREVSPIDNVEKFPNIPYVVFQCEKDSDVKKEFHAEKLIEKMNELNKKVTYVVVPDSEHCQLNDYYLNQYFESIKKELI